MYRVHLIKAIVIHKAPGNTGTCSPSKFRRLRHHAFVHDRRSRYQCNLSRSKVTLLGLAGNTENARAAWLAR